jgi:hypothetical protein
MSWQLIRSCWIVFVYLKELSFVYTSVRNKFCVPIAYKEPESADYVGVDLACEYGTPAYIGGIFEL